MNLSKAHRIEIERLLADIKMLETTARSHLFNDNHEPYAERLLNDYKIFGGILDHDYCELVKHAQFLRWLTEAMARYQKDHL